jgi:hypothetical protein
MKMKFWALSVLLFLAAGCAALEPIEVREKTYGKAVPVITLSFASKQIRPGETWMVYLNASDPDGDMNYIVCMIDQPGVGSYSPAYTRIKEDEGKELSGYIHLNTAGVSNLNFINLTLQVQVQDKARHFSAPVSFPLSINNRYQQEPPPKDTFKEKDLGPIMITLRTLGGGMGHLP